LREIDRRAANIDKKNGEINELLNFVKERPYKNKNLYQE
jgi:hypothetical protein